MKLKVLIICILFFSVNLHFFPSQAVSTIHVEEDNSSEPENNILDKDVLSDSQYSSFFFQELHVLCYVIHFFHENPAFPVPIRPPKYSV